MVTQNLDKKGLARIWIWDYKNNNSWWSHQDLNPGLEPSALTTWSRCLFLTNLRDFCSFLAPYTLFRPKTISGFNGIRGHSPDKFCRIFNKSFLSVKRRASFRIFSVIWGRAAAKYWNSLLVGFWVERLCNSKQVFRDTPSAIARWYQFSESCNVESRAKAISSKRPAWSEEASIFGDVITSLTFSESAQPAVKEIWLTCLVLCITSCQ